MYEGQLVDELADGSTGLDLLLTTKEDLFWDDLAGGP